ncbi:DUF6776 family protein [Xanthomonas massiliensis]|jgi:hypothetical protein|uniref:DUF6776 family protein n=1 Tax=Xanthomonas massiliensis TaxID=1720302 RepID=UPI0008247E19|nr:DUF6776 family protein [Xanthomonas massiliensis]
MNRPVTRYRIVAGSPAAPARRWLPWVLLAAWLASLPLVWLLASHLAEPRLGQARADLERARAQIAAQQGEIARLHQEQANLQLSDKVSRAANTEVQASLAEREEEIASLRADVAFYERLVGATGQRKGLNVHSVEFAPEAGGTWHYTVVLTQNLNRGAVSQGRMSLAVEGVRHGKLETVAWDALHQKAATPGQDYSFRYFQQLDGSVILPKDFTPQRVRVSLAGGATPVSQVFDWNVAGNGKRNEGE